MNYFNVAYLEIIGDYIIRESVINLIFHGFRIIKIGECRQAKATSPA